MLFPVKVTVPANTLKTAAQETKVSLPRGVLSRIEFRFPPGPQFLLHLQLLYGSTVFSPFGADYDVAGDDEGVEDHPSLELPSDPTEVTVRGWNDDDSYPHSAIVRIEVVPEDVAKVLGIIPRKLDQLIQSLRATGPLEAL